MSGLKRIKNLTRHLINLNFEDADLQSLMTIEQSTSTQLIVLFH